MQVMNNASWEHRVLEVLRSATFSGPKALDRLIYQCRSAVEAGFERNLLDGELDPPELVSLHAACHSIGSTGRNGREMPFDTYTILLPIIRDIAVQYLMESGAAVCPPASLEKEGIVKIPLSVSRGLLSLNFFCALPVSESQFNRVSFLRLYLAGGGGGSQGKDNYNPVAHARILCMLEYFHRCFVSCSSENGNGELAGELVVVRRKAGGYVNFPVPQWESCSSISVVPAELTDERLEDVPGVDAHVDFANKTLHIGAVIPSATQEEVMFSIRPDLFTVMLVAGKVAMADDEAILVSGARRFSLYTGYLRTFEWAGPVAKLEERAPTVVAIDATVVQSRVAQYSQAQNTRDVTKCWLGFLGGRDFVSASPQPAWAVSTGAWGCGAFGGDPVLKYLQQCIGASAAGVRLVFSCYGNASLREQLEKVNKLLDGRPLAVSELFHAIDGFANLCRANVSSADNDSGGDMVRALANVLGSRYVKAFKNWLRAGDSEEAGDMAGSVALYRSAFKTWPELDTRIVAGVPVGVMHQYDETFESETSSAARIARNRTDAVAPYLSGSIEDMENRAQRAPESDLASFLRNMFR